MKSPLLSETSRLTRPAENYGADPESAPSNGKVALHRRDGITRAVSWCRSRSHTWLVLVCILCGSADAVNKHVLLKAGVPPKLSATVGSALSFGLQVPMVLVTARLTSWSRLQDAATSLRSHARLPFAVATLSVAVLNFCYSLANSYSSQPAVVSLLVGISYIWSSLLTCAFTRGSSLGQADQLRQADHRAGY